MDNDYPGIRYPIGSFVLCHPGIKWKTVVLRTDKQPALLITEFIVSMKEIRSTGSSFPRYEKAGWRIKGLIEGNYVETASIYSDGGAMMRDFQMLSNIEDALG